MAYLTTTSLLIISQFQSIPLVWGKLRWSKIPTAEICTPVLIPNVTWKNVNVYKQTFCNSKKTEISFKFNDDTAMRSITSRHMKHFGHVCIILAYMILLIKPNGLKINRVLPFTILKKCTKFNKYWCKGFLWILLTSLRMK